MTEHGNKVEAPSKIYEVEQEDRDTITALRSSTRGMRAAGITYLPREDEEGDPRYRRRLDRSFLFAALDDTIEKLVSKPFAQEVTLRGELPEPLDPLLKNADLAGTTLSMFARRLFDVATANGKAHVFVDFQQVAKVEETLDRKLTAKDTQTGLVRPYFVFIDPNDLIGWKEWTAENGEKMVVELRWKEIREEEDGIYGTKQVDHIRVVRNPPDEPGAFELHRKDDEGEGFTQVGETGSFEWGQPGLPFFTHYTQRDGFMAAHPPLRDLMWKNIEHWQRSSDLSQALRFAALIMLLGTGLPGEIVTKGLPLGHGATHLFAQKDAMLKWVEADGSSIKVLEENLDKLQEEMETLGLAPLMRKTQNTTATSQKSTDNKNEAPIQSWVRDLNGVMTAAINAAGVWINVDIGDLLVEVFNEFKLAGSRTEIVKELREIRKNGDMSLKLFLMEIQKHAFISDEVDIDKEIQEILDEKERMAEMFAVPVEDDPPDPNAPPEPGGGDE